VKRESYADVLRIPGAAALFGSALIGRLAFATVSLSLLLSVQAATGTFAAAGAATGAFGVTNVIASPARARAVDRFGPTRSLLVMGVLFAASLVATAIGCLAGAPAWLLIGLAAVAGVFAPPLGSTMRVMWAAIAPDARILPRAYSLDAVAEELLFTTGPLLVGLIVLVASPVAALFTTAGVALAGTVLFCLHRHVRAKGPATTTAHAHERPLRQRGFPTVLVALTGVGLVIGTVETAVPAFTAERSMAAVSGILLALLAAGSAVGGLVYGHRNWKPALAIRLVVLSIAFVAVSAIAALAPEQITLGVVLFGLGLFLAPTVITAYLLADALTAEHVRTEATTWTNTAVNFGVAVGAAVAGLLVDHAGTTTAFAVGAAVAGVLVLAAGTRTRTLKEASTHPVHSGGHVDAVGQVDAGGQVDAHPIAEEDGTTPTAASAPGELPASRGSVED